MIFFLDNGGNVIKSFPSPVYQGSVNANNIYVIAPFAENLTAAVAFKLPNGIYTERFVMTPVNEISGVTDVKTGKTYSGWQFSMPNTITKYFGTVTAQFFFYVNGAIVSSASTNFPVGKGVPEILPEEPTADVYNQILDNLSALSQQVNNGAFAARSLYAWNSEYNYGANEITYYPDVGQYGVFVKSLVDNNNQNPYIDGKLNSQYWEEVVDINILNELYSISTDMREIQAEVQENAKEAVQSAANAAESADIAETAADRIDALADYIENVQDGTEAVPKAVSDDSGNNIAQQFTEINELIPSTASEDNQLADKAFVNSSINNLAAFYITYNAVGDKAFPTRVDLLNATTFYSGGKERVPTQNDYAIVLADESQPKGADGSYPTTRYSYQGGTYPDGQWDFQYVVNNTSLTQAQVDALNSGITQEIVEQISKGNVLGVKGANETAYRTGNVNLTPDNIGAAATSGTYPDLIAGKALSSMYGFACLPATVPNPTRWYKLLSFVASAYDGNRTFRTQGVTLLYRDIFANLKGAEGILILKIRTGANKEWVSADTVLQIMPFWGSTITADNFRVTYDSATGLVTLWFKGTSAYQNITVTQLSKDFRQETEIPNITYYSTNDSGVPAANITTSLPNDIYTFTEDAFYTEQNKPTASDIGAAPSSSLTDGSVTKVGTATKGSTTVPIYLSGGTPTACTRTIPAITLNGTSNTAPSFYAPTSVGAKGDILYSQGSGAPIWKKIEGTILYNTTSLSTGSKTLLAGMSNYGFILFVSDTGTTGGAGTAVMLPTTVFKSFYAGSSHRLCLQTNTNEYITLYYYSDTQIYIYSQSGVPNFSIYGVL